MKKIIRTALATSTLLVASMPLTQAADITNSFNVSVTFSAQCRAKDDGTKTLDFGTYTAFQAGVQNATGINIEFECSRGLVPTTVAFDVINGTAVGGGVIAGLNYDMEIGIVVVTAGTAATSAVNDIGTADLRSYPITGSMAALQAGQVGAAASHTRQLIVSY